MFSQLLANKELLEGAPIVIIVSPGWFYDPFSDGTSYSVFLEYNSDLFLDKILNDKDSEFRDYAIERFYSYSNEIVNPALSTRAFLHEHSAGKSISTNRFTVHFQV